MAITRRGRVRWSSTSWTTGRWTFKRWQSWRCWMGCHWRYLSSTWQVHIVAYLIDKRLDYYRHLGWWMTGGGNLRLSERGHNAQNQGKKKLLEWTVPLVVWDRDRKPYPWKENPLKGCHRLDMEDKLQLDWWGAQTRHDERFMGLCWEISERFWIEMCRFRA